MATDKYFPTVTSDFVDLVETMRRADDYYLEMIMDRDGKFTQFQERRAAQAAKVARDRVDQWIAQYRKDLKAYVQAFEARKTDETQGTFNV